MFDQIYECGLLLEEKVPHRTGNRAAVFGNQPQLPLIFTEPLVFNWTRRIKGLPIPRLDDGALVYNQPMNLARLNRRLAANITVENCPEWIFVKLYCYGFFSHDQPANIGEDAVKFFNQVIENGVKKGDYKIYFASAREAFNMVSAAIDGKTGSPGEFRNYRPKTIMNEKTREEKSEIRRQIELC